MTVFASAGADRRARVLVAGMGNVLRGDDGFGVEVARRVAARPDLPAGVRVVDVGIGGIALVQELLDGYGLLVIVDAARSGRPPGSLTVSRLEIPGDAAAAPAAATVGDPHATTPSRVLLMARAVGALPDLVLLVGCEPETSEEFDDRLSPSVARAVEPAVREVLAVTRQWLDRIGPHASGAAGGERIIRPVS